MNNRTCHPALQVHVIIGGEASKEVNYITNILKTYVMSLSTSFNLCRIKERKKKYSKITLNEKQSVRPLWAGVVVAPGNRSTVGAAGAGRRSAAALQKQQEAQKQTQNQRDHQVALTVGHLQEHSQS